MVSFILCLALLIVGYFVYGKIVETVGAQVLAIVSCPLISVGYMTSNMVIIFLALGASIGAWGSLLSMRRFLDT